MHNFIKVTFNLKSSATNQAIHSIKIIELIERNINSKWIEDLSKSGARNQHFMFLMVKIGQPGC